MFMLENSAVIWVIIHYLAFYFLTINRSMDDKLLRKIFNIVLRNEIKAKFGK
jgi:hypothetical protein